MKIVILLAMAALFAAVYSAPADKTPQSFAGVKVAPQMTRLDRVGSDAPHLLKEGPQGEPISADYHVVTKDAPKVIPKSLSATVIKTPVVKSVRTKEEWFKYDRRDCVQPGNIYMGRKSATKKPNGK